MDEFEIVGPCGHARFMRQAGGFMLELYRREAKHPLAWAYLHPEGAKQLAVGEAPFLPESELRFTETGEGIEIRKLGTGVLVKLAAADLHDLHRWIIAEE